MNRQWLIGKLLACFVLLSLIISDLYTNITFAQGALTQTTTTNSLLFLPMITNGNGGDKPPSAPPTATTRPDSATPTATATTAPDLPTPTPTATATPIIPARNLPAALVGTWFNGNAPLNDFYNPQTGEWRDVSGLGQMYVFAADGAYTYTGFLRIQTGTCRSEVSTFKQGVAESDGATLVLHPTHTRTRTVIICPTAQESITEGSQAPVNVGWTIGDDGLGREQLSITEGESVTHYAKRGMATALVGTWDSDELTSADFYDPATDTFNLASPLGMWFKFAADGTYTYGEHSHGTPDAQGCVVTWWVYQAGTMTVSGSNLTPKPATGALRLENSCNPDQPSQEAWLDAERTYVWLFRDQATAPKLVLIPLERYVEFIFKPE
ncbi:MAG: hypothetical protein NT075_33545 [Chloroflexi bacterium]|nr:hypothetical protein [Chloroflexota bacterium]